MHLFTTLLKKSQFHGINRLADKNFRVHWAVALVLLFISAIMSLLITIYRYESNPTYLSRIEHYDTRIVFPSVLICPELDFPEFRMADFLQEVKIPSDLNKTYLMGVLRQLASYYSPDVPYTVRDLENIERLIDYNKLNLEYVAIRLTASCEETLIRCRWRGTIMNCSSLFRLEVMQFGFCCVFNGRSLKRDIRQFGFRVPKPVNSVFSRMIGYHSGLMMAVNQSTELRNIDLSYKWIMVTGSQRYVDALNVNGSALSPGIEVWFGYFTDGFLLSDSARSLSQELRRCRMYSDNLKYFPVYRKQYCRLECEMSQMLKKCNCSMPTHPILVGPRCKAKTITCARNESRLTNPETCNCLTTCDVDMDMLTTTSYDLSTAIRPIDNFYDGLDFKKTTIVRIYLHTREMSKSSRQSYFSAFDLFAQMGGIFNVFFGCSVLSLLELLQLLYHYLRGRKQSRAVAEDRGLQTQDRRREKQLRRTNKRRLAET